MRYKSLCFTRILLLGLSLIVPVTSIAAEPSFYQVDGATYDPAIPEPREVIGHDLGEQPVQLHLHYRYLAEIAALSDRVTMEPIGQSHEGRPIQLLTVTSPGNHARLDSIRQQHVALSSGKGGTSPSDDMPVIIWLGYGVHGAEAAGMETALPVLYHLAAARDESVETVLENSVILIATVLNPDGHSHRIDHKMSFMTQADVVDPAFAGNDLWASFRSNHYWFDLNRQWLLLTQPESRAWVEQWHKWKPNLTADFHEMGTVSVRPATYFFSPGDPERSSPQIPSEVQKLKVKASESMHAAFDREKRLYFTEESFDNFYIGTGSSYPDVNGSLGFLFEVGTARSGTIVTSLGERTYRDNIAMHFTSSLATIEAGNRMRKELLAFQKSFVDDALDLARNSQEQAFVFASPDKSRLAQFADMLDRHQIEIYTLVRDLKIDDALFKAGDAVVVPLNQPQYRLIRSIFDRNLDFEEAVFYDVSGWTLPLAYNLDYAVIGRGKWSDKLAGERTVPALPTAPEPGRTSYAYAFGWTDYYAPRALYRLLDAKVITRMATVPVKLQTTEGQVKLDRGAIVVPLARQTTEESEIHEIVKDIASIDGITVHTVVSGRTKQAGADLGSGGSFATLTKPRVLLAFGDGIQSFDAGDIWHLMDHQMHIPAILKQKDRLDEIHWPDYTHLVLPGGKDGGVGLDAKTTERVKRWVKENGGTVIGIRQGAKWAQEELLGRRTTESQIGYDIPARIDYEDFRVKEAEHIVGGTIFASDLDITHPIGFGYDRRLLPSHRDTSIVLDYPANPYAVVARYKAGNPVLSGYASVDRVEEIQGSPMLVAERLGEGSVILMVDNPAFRATYLGTSKLFLNSLFFSDAFSAPKKAGGAHYRP